MGFIGFLILGLACGAIAKLIIPGRQGGGWFMTLILGIVGAMLGGWIAGAVTGTGLAEFWSWHTWLFAVIGAIVVLLIWGLVFGRRKA